jgi:hypothetical protein
VQGSGTPEDGIGIAAPLKLESQHCKTEGTIRSTPQRRTLNSAPATSPTIADATRRTNVDVKLLDRAESIARRATDAGIFNRFWTVVRTCRTRWELRMGIRTVATAENNSAVARARTSLELSSSSTHILEPPVSKPVSVARLYSALINNRRTTTISRSQLPGADAKAAFDKFKKDTEPAAYAKAQSLKFGRSTFDVVSGVKEGTSLHQFYTSTGKYLGGMFDSDG